VQIEVYAIVSVKVDTVKIVIPDNGHSTSTKFKRLAIWYLYHGYKASLPSPDFCTIFSLHILKIPIT